MVIYKTKIRVIIDFSAFFLHLTTFSDFIRFAISYTNLYRLCCTSDQRPTGKIKAEKMYDGLLTYIKSLENMSINLLFDRTFFTEEIYCRLGKKEYSFTDVFDRLLDELAHMDFDIYYITLYLSDTDDFARRLNRPGKAAFKNSQFNVSNSIDQQEAYLQLADEIKYKYPNIHVINIDTCLDIEKNKEYLKEILS